MNVSLLRLIKKVKIVSHLIIFLCFYSFFPFLLLKSSNFSITDTTFASNWASIIIDVFDSSLNISKSSFEKNNGFLSGVFEVTTKKENLSFLFSEDNFSKNSGINVSSVLFKEIIPPVRFEYCHFEKLRFEEVNGDLDKEQLFHRCRFENSLDFENVYIEKKKYSSNWILFGLFVFLNISGIILFFKIKNQEYDPLL